jgi:hypothetical protein
MKAINAVKKMVAVGTAATMLGATIMGASAASLGAFPRPFVVDGVPANNFLMAVGKSAAGEDVVGAIDIIQYLQQKLSVPSSGDGRRARVTTGDYVEIGRPTDILELGETIGSVVETVTEADLPTLLPRFVFNPANGAVTVVNQYLRFPDTSNELVNFTSSNQVQYAKDEFDNVGYFFRVQNNAPVVTWLGQFEEGAESDLILLVVKQQRLVLLVERLVQRDYRVSWIVTLTYWASGIF